MIPPEEKQTLPYGAVTIEMLRAIRKARKGLNSHEIMDALADKDIWPERQSIQVMLCNNVKRGYLKRVKADCQICGRLTTRFRMTEEGAIHLAQRERESYS